jgi:hypothetical protein
MKEKRERREAISRTLIRLANAARFYALQVKNEHIVAGEALSEMKMLLTDYEEQTS